MDEPILTRAAKLKVNAAKNFLSVNCEVSRKKPKDSAGKLHPTTLRRPLKSTPIPKTNFENDEAPSDPRKQQQLEMKRARYDVIKFGMSGFDKKEALKAKMSLAISLGAKPPRNRRLNYKDLKNERAEQKEKSRKLESHSSGVDQSIHRLESGTKNRIRKAKDSNILKTYGKVARKSVGK